MWGTLNIQVLPAVVPDLVGSEIQGTAIGAIVFIGLLIAVVVQPVAGALSDRARFRVGRRRPFMAAGVLLCIPFLIVIGVLDIAPCRCWAPNRFEYSARSISGCYSGSRTP